MEIRSVEAFAIRMPPKGEATSEGQREQEERGHYRISNEGWSSVYSSRHETCLVRLETEDGTVGWGEGQAPVTPATVKTIVEELCRPLLEGRDPFDVEYIWYRLYSAMRERGHITGFYVDALAAVDLAIYDLLGKLLGKPAYRVMGGKFRDRIRVYAGIGGTDADAVAEAAAKHVGFGYDALKLHLRSSNRGIGAIAAAVRERVGPDIELMVDVHGSRDVSLAIQLGRALEALDVRWLEAPCLAEDVKGHAEVARALDLQVATGEWLRTAWEWRQWIDFRGFDAAMPDIARTGLTEGKRIAGLCDAYNLPVSPHVGGGGILSVAATIQYSASIPNFQIMEHSHAAHANKARITKTCPEVSDGAFVLDDVPGLGVEVDEEAVREFSA